MKQSFSLLYHYFTLSRVATVPTVYGIETSPSTSDQPHHYYKLQQYLPVTMCAEGCETTEAQSDDEVRTSQIPEQSEGETDMMR